MKQRLVMFLAVLFLSIEIALAQTQATVLSLWQKMAPMSSEPQLNPNRSLGFGFIDILAMISSS